jgi:hypothetical protein
MQSTHPIDLPASGLPEVLTRVNAQERVYPGVILHHFPMLSTLATQSEAQRRTCGLWPEIPYFGLKIVQDGVSRVPSDIVRSHLCLISLTGTAKRNILLF